MPIAIEQVVPLSKHWTHQDLVSQAMLITDTTDNNKIHFNHVRAHVNIAISNVAELISKAKLPYYGIDGVGTFESDLTVGASGRLQEGLDVPQGTNLVLHHTGLAQIKTKLYHPMIPAGGYWNTILAQVADVYLDDIIEISCLAKATVPSASSMPAFIYWSGKLTKLSLPDILQLVSMKNESWRNSAAWCWHGDTILFFFGQNISSNLVGSYPPLAIPPSTIAADYNGSCGTINIFGYRQPKLDNLLAINKGLASSWAQKIDLPDKYMKLVLQMTQVMIMEQLNQIIPAQLEASIAQAIQQIQANLQSNLQMNILEKKS
jgi:hypothetical protein